MKNQLLTFSFISLLTFGAIALQGMDNSHSDHSSDRKLSSKINYNEH